MKIRPPQCSYTTHLLFVAIVALPALLGWIAGSGSFAHWLATSFRAGIAYWVIYGVWWGAAMLSNLPRRPPQ